jgi:hypothetical protein
MAGRSGPASSGRGSKPNPAVVTERLTRIKACQKTLHAAPSRCAIVASAATTAPPTPTCMSTAGSVPKLVDGVRRRALTCSAIWAKGQQEALPRFRLHSRSAFADAECAEEHQDHSADSEDSM